MNAKLRSPGLAFNGKEHRQWSQFVYILASLQVFVQNANLFLNFFTYKVGGEHIGVLCASEQSCAF